MNRAILRCLWLAIGIGWCGASTLPAQVSLIATGSVWRFLDQGTAPAGWNTASFADEAWPSGPARFGLGGSPSSKTLLNQTNLAGSTNLTFYFRRSFLVPDPAAYTNLLVRICRDDGAVVYLNGVEVYRNNMPPGPILATTPASGPALDDGLFFQATSLPAAGLRPGTNVMAVEIHQATSDSHDLAFELELTANTQPLPPSIRLVQPAHDDVLGTSHILLAAETGLSPDPVVWVEFLAGQQSLGGTLEPNQVLHRLLWTNAPPGRHTLQAVALNSIGLSTTSAPVLIEVLPALVPRGAHWKYLDDGSDPGTGWTAPAFEDGAWAAGPAELGFGDGDEATLVRSGPPGESHPTTYFRHAFTVADPATISHLTLRVLRDDAVLVHLNGVEVYRNNLPEGPINAFTPSLAAIDDPLFHATPIPPARLVAGRNVLAVEVHQSGPSSSDLSLDLELIPNLAPRPPRVALTQPANGTSWLGPLDLEMVAVTWDPDDPVVSVALYSGNALLGTSTPDVVGKSLAAGRLAPGLHLLRAVATDASGLSTTSAPVTVQVIAAPVFTTLIPTGSVWRYFDSAGGPAGDWRQPDYPDSGWGSGAGILGFGGLGNANALATTLIQGGPVGNRHLAAYFRHRFQASSVGTVTGLAFRVVRDDGVVAYLNGTELFRMNMPPGPITPTTPANANVSGTNELFYAPIQIAIPPGLLQPGDNLLAVELHQDSVITSDAAFDLGLVSISSPRPPLSLSLGLAGTDLMLSWTEEGAVLQQAPAPQGPYLDLPGGSNPRLLPATNGPGFFRLRQGP